MDRAGDEHVLVGAEGVGADDVGVVPVPGVPQGEVGVGHVQGFDQKSTSTSCSWRPLQIARPTWAAPRSVMTLPSKGCSRARRSAVDRSRSGNRRPTASPPGSLSVVGSSWRRASPAGRCARRRRAGRAWRRTRRGAAAGPSTGRGTGRTRRRARPRRWRARGRRTRRRWPGGAARARTRRSRRGRRPRRPPSRARRRPARPSRGCGRSPSRRTWRPRPGGPAPVGSGGAVPPGCRSSSGSSSGGGPAGTGTVSGTPSVTVSTAPVGCSWSNRAMRTGAVSCLPSAPVDMTLGGAVPASGAAFGGASDMAAVLPGRCVSAGSRPFRTVGGPPEGTQEQPPGHDGG